MALRLRANSSLSNCYLDKVESLQCHDIDGSTAAYTKAVNVLDQIDLSNRSTVSAD